MNTAMVTGYLVRSAERAYTPGGVGKVVFEVMVPGEFEGEATPWRCEMEMLKVNTDVIERLKPGSAVILRAQLAGRPYERNGVQSGFTRFLLVDRVEFSRMPAAAKEA